MTLSSRPPWGQETNVDDGGSLQRITSGVTNLDVLLGGGLVRGSAYIVQGSPGAGKTILANQACFERVRNGERALYLTLLSESFGQMFAFLDGMEFFDRERIPEMLYYASVYGTMRDDGLRGLARLIHEEIRKRRPSLVVLDGLFVAGEGSGETEHEFRQFVNELSAIGSMSQTTLLLLTNSRRKPSSPEYTMVDGWIEMADALLTDGRAQRTMAVHKHRGGPILRGRHDYVIRSDGITVFPRLETLASRTPPEVAPTGRLSTGVEALDRMTEGGLPESSTSVVLGPTGTGKTTIGLQFLSRCTPQDPGLFVGFYETPERIRLKAARIGLDLAALEASGALTILWRPPLGNLIDEVGQYVLDAVGELRAKRLVIDGINALRRPVENTARLHAFLRAFNDMLKTLGVTTFYTREVPQLFFPEALAIDELSGVIDNTFLLHYAIEGDDVRRRAAILKLRDSDFDHVSREYRITSSGLVFRERDSGRKLQEMATSAPVAGSLAGRTL